MIHTLDPLSDGNVQILTLQIYKYTHIDSHHIFKSY